MEKRFIVWWWGGCMLEDKCTTLLETDNFDKARKFAYEFYASKLWFSKPIIYIDDMNKKGMFGIQGCVCYKTRGWEKFINFNPEKEGFKRHIHEIFIKEDLEDKEKNNV